MQRLVFVLVLTTATFVIAQVRPGQTREPLLPPTVVVDMASSLPLAARPADAQRSSLQGNAVVTVSDLAVPVRARKELEKANQSLARQNWTQARDRLTKAISFYPSFAGAYNNLAIAYAYLGDVGQQRRALEKAIALDANFTLAYRNLGRMDIRQGNLLEAEAALNRASILEPEDPISLGLLSYCQLLQKHLDDAIATSRQAHRLTAPHAFAHYVAARAFEQKQQLDHAAAELTQFLQEMPTGPVAEDVRNELQIVQAELRK